MNTCCKAVIFDLDGTLLDTIKDLGHSMNYILEKHGYEKRENEHFVRSIGNGLRKFAERCLPENAATDEILDIIVPELIAYYGEHHSEKTVPFDGISELLDYLSDNGIIINILSNKRDEFVKELALHYFPRYDFFCADGETPDMPKKPDPASALKIAKKCNVDPCDILFVGDSIYDIITGKNAGMRTVAVTWGYQPENMLQAEKPDFLATTPTDIIDYIKNSDKYDEEIKRVSKLAKLSFNEKETATLKKNISVFLELAEQLTEVDTVEFSPSTHSTQAQALLRDDEERHSLEKEETLKNSKFHDENYITVPKVVD